MNASARTFFSECSSVTDQRIVKALGYGPSSTGRAWVRYRAVGTVDEHPILGLYAREPLEVRPSHLDGAFMGDDVAVRDGGVVDLVGLDLCQLAVVEVGPGNISHSNRSCRPIPEMRVYLVL